MTVKEKIEQDLKTAMLAGDKARVSALRLIKSALLYAEVEVGKRTEGLADEDAIKVLQKEAKKRQESADLYAKGGNVERAEQEQAEKAIIDSYLPEQMSLQDMKALADKVIASLNATSVSDMGRVMSAARESTTSNLDGATLARIVKEKLTGQ